MRLPEWHYDHGIGEDRAILVEDGQIIEARIERHDGIKPGLVCPARLTETVVGGSRGIIELVDGGEALLSPLPKGLTVGAPLMVEITRSAIDEKSRFKLPQARVAIDREPGPAPELADRVRVDGLTLNLYWPHDAEDRFEAHGWSEILDQARTGVVPFDGGNLQIALTPAMTLIDVDGNLPPVVLAMKAAPAVAHAIRLFDLQGNIGIDFPALDDKGDRKRVADAFDAAMDGDHERTAINGFGFMQIVTRRVRQSLPEMQQYRPALGAALALLRRAEREHGAGGLTLVAHPVVIKRLAERDDWIEALSGRLGRSVSLREDAALDIGGGYVENSR